MSNDEDEIKRILRQLKKNAGLSNHSAGTQDHDDDETSLDVIDKIRRITSKKRQ